METNQLSANVQSQGSCFLFPPTSKINALLASPAIFSSFINSTNSARWSWNRFYLSFCHHNPYFFQSEVCHVKGIWNLNVESGKEGGVSQQNISSGVTMPCGYSALHLFPQTYQSSAFWLSKVNCELEGVAFFCLHLLLSHSSLENQSKLLHNSELGSFKITFSSPSAFLHLFFNYLSTFLL